MEQVRYAVPPQHKTQVGSGDERQLAILIEHLITTCDHYAAQYTQECLLREDQQIQLTQVQALIEAQKLELEQLRELLAQQENTISSQNDTYTETMDALAGKTFCLLTLGDQLAQELGRKEKQCARQMVQIGYLNAQNLRYQRLYQRITQTWYGKILVKIYHLFQKFGWI